MARVFVMSNNGSPAIVKKNFNNINNKNDDRGLEREKSYHEDKNRKRENIFQDLISGSKVHVSWVKGFFTTLGIIVAGFPVTFLFTLVPAHDLIKNPECWYEILIHGAILHTSRPIAFCLPNSWFMNISQMRTPRTLVTACIFSNLVTTCWLVVGYYVWTHFFFFQYPIPFVGYSIYGVELIVIMIVLFIRCPKRWHKSNSFKNQMKYFVILILEPNVLDAANTVVTQILRLYPNQYQTLIALLLPLNREITLFIFSKIIAKTANGDYTGAEIILNYSVSVQHTIWLCYNLGSFTTNVTSWTLMGIDFSLNIFLCVQMVWRKIRKHNKIDEQISTLQHLAAYELAEFHAPLSFLVMFVVAYYGPNSKLFGNISNDYWGFTPIEDIHGTIQNMLVFFVVDFASTIVSGIMLWSFCKINLWKAFLVLQKEFGTIFGIILADFLYIVSIL